MLNQRRHINETKGNDDEQEALLGSSNYSSNSILSAEFISGNHSIDQHRTLNASQFDRLNNIQSNCHNLQRVGVSNPDIEVPIVLPLPIQRKTRDKSPPEDVLQPSSGFVARHTSGSNSLTTLRQVLHHQSAQGDSIEFGVSDNSYSRAIDLSSRNNNSHVNTRHISDYIYYAVQPGDTLLNLSIKYSCSVAAIKRLNNLWSDSEIHGLTTLKLPVGKLRLIEDVLSAENRLVSPASHITSLQASDQQNTGAYGPIATDNIDHMHHSRNIEKVVRASCQPTTSSDLDDLRDLQYQFSSESIFRDHDLNIEKAKLAARCYDENASEIMQSLAQSGNIVDEEDPNERARREAESLLNDMSDYGLSYNGLILFMFIICLICPLAFVIYLDETHKTKHPDLQH